VHSVHGRHETAESHIALVDKLGLQDIELTTSLCT